MSPVHLSLKLEHQIEPFAQHVVWRINLEALRLAGPLALSKSSYIGSLRIGLFIVAPWGGVGVLPHAEQCFLAFPGREGISAATKNSHFCVRNAVFLIKNQCSLDGHLLHNLVKGEHGGKTSWIQKTEGQNICYLWLLCSILQ